MTGWIKELIVIPETKIPGRKHSGKVTLVLSIIPEIWQQKLLLRYTSFRLSQIFLTLGSYLTYEIILTFELQCCMYQKVNSKIFLSFRYCS